MRLCLILPTMMFPPLKWCVFVEFTLHSDQLVSGRVPSLGKFCSQRRRRRSSFIHQIHFIFIFFGSSTISSLSFSKHHNHPSQGSSAPFELVHQCALLKVNLTPSSGSLLCLKTMPPGREVSSEESNATTSTPVEELVLALHELI
jgi:hypothetical protein